MAFVSSPTTRGRRLAFELRNLRSRTGLTPTQAARQLGWSLSKLTRIERAQTQPKIADIEAALALYGVDTAKRAALIQLAKESWKRGWWTAYADVFSGSIVALEDEASLIHAWEPQLVPGLLQTEEYASAIIGLLRLDAESVHRRVVARMNRGMLLRRPNGPNLHALLDESVLRRIIGSHEVMRGQLSALVRAAERPNITIQVVRLDAGAHIGLEGAMELISFAEDSELDVAYAEGPMGDIYLESTEEVNRIRVDLESIRSTAMSPSASVELITALAGE
ncbi:helix-turn-helix domain-containing protein [Actinomadura xylanilytica]|uniref:helix-turn-helix domain-containing protein n=1 Tax=Actinomadura xylanilytica TaxID=887459 RepID=UPI00255B2949|nr:helix-turn-helix transcriptional regulator [Actinomadura xylanilytica]MDL4772598.1 helix-turn-helix transcriptional regulator [Actinomadura xylanilytica]